MASILRVCVGVLFSGFETEELKGARSFPRRGSVQGLDLEIDGRVGDGEGLGRAIYLSFLWSKPL